MLHLQKLYDEIAPELNELITKRNELEAEKHAIRYKVEEAEKEYNVSGLEKLNAQLASIQSIFDRVKSDIEVKLERLNGRQGQSLKRAVSEAASKDFNEANRSQKVQNKFKELDAARKEVVKIEREIYQASHKKAVEIIGLAEEFRPFLRGIYEGTSLARPGNFYEI